MYGYSFSLLRARDKLEYFTFLYLFLLIAETNRNRPFCCVYDLAEMRVYTLSLSDQSVLETFKVVLNFESVDEILWCDHSNESC